MLVFLPIKNIWCCKSIFVFKSWPIQLGVVVHAFNPSTWEAEAGGFLSLRPAWFTKWVPGQPGLYRENPVSKNQKKRKKKKSWPIPWFYNTWHQNSITMIYRTAVAYLGTLKNSWKICSKPQAKIHLIDSKKKKKKRERDSVSNSNSDFEKNKCSKNTN
jgi:hypothetical protein